MDKTTRQANIETLALRVVRALKEANDTTPTDHPAKVQIRAALAIAEEHYQAVCVIDHLPNRPDRDLLDMPGTVRHFNTVSR